MSRLQKTQTTILSYKYVETDTKLGGLLELPSGHPAPQYCLGAITALIQALSTEYQIDFGAMYSDLYKEHGTFLTEKYKKSQGEAGIIWRKEENDPTCQ